MIRSGKALCLAATVALVALVALGCGTKNENFGCATVPAQGGPVIGDWNVDAQRSCQAPYDRVTSADWCSQLVFDANGVKVVQLGHPTLTLANGTVSFDGGGHYKSDLNFATNPGEASTHFPVQCLRAYGLEPTCGELQGALEAFLMDNGAAMLSYRLLPNLMTLPLYPFDLVPQPSYTSFACTDDGANGCDCTYIVGLHVPDRGSWNTDKTTVLSMFSETSPALPFDNDFISAGGGLAMTGHAGNDLFAQQGLRTMVLTK